MIHQIIRALNTKNEVLISGAAGTGKTTLVKEVVNTWPGEVILTAPTGKAARRLNEVTNSPAFTIHSTFFGPPETVEGEPIFKNLKRVGGRGTLIVVDEVSMVGIKLLTAMRKAARVGTKFLFVGDENQVLPVLDTCPFNWAEADIKLTEVHRSKGDVLAYAQQILKCKNSSELKELVLHPEKEDVTYHQIKNLIPSAWKTQDLSRMLITPTNKLRFAINDAVRARRGHTNPLNIGEHLLVRSNHPLMLMNGDLVEILDIPEKAPLWAGYKDIIVGNELSDRLRVSVVPAGFKSDAVEFRQARLKDYARWRKEGIEGVTPMSTLHTHYGYGFTVYSAQGSEADEVGVVWSALWTIDKNFDNAKRQIYTAVTRAKKKVNLWIHDGI